MTCSPPLFFVLAAGACAAPDPSAAAAPSQVLVSPSAQAAPPPDPASAPFPTDPSGVVKLDPDLVQEIVRVKGEYDAISDAASLAKAYRDAEALCGTLRSALQPLEDKQDKNFYSENFQRLDLGWLVPALPGLDLEQCGDSPDIFFGLAADPWIAKAKATPGEVDDLYINLMASTYRQVDSDYASRALWPRWFEQNWDYGGCNTFGDGTVVEALKEADKARMAGDLFTKEIEAFRVDALEQAFTPWLQYCDGGASKRGGKVYAATPARALRAEARRILAEVKLSPEERAQIKARIPKLKGEDFSDDKQFGLNCEESIGPRRPSDP